MLDNTMWSTMGDIWTKILLEGRVRADNITIINNLGKTSMKDIGEVFYRSNRLGRSICKHLRIVGERFHYGSVLQMSESVRTYPHSIQVDVDYMQSFPKCALHRSASILGASNRDEELMYHSSDTEVTFMSEDNKISFSKKVVSSDDGWESINFEAEESDDDDDFGDAVDEEDNGMIPTSSFEIESEIKPIILYSWEQCGFCDKQEKVIDQIRDSEHGEDFESKVNIIVLKEPIAPDDRVTAFPTWIIRDKLEPGFKEAPEILSMLKNI